MRRLPTAFMAEEISMATVLDLLQTSFLLLFRFPCAIIQRFCSFCNIFSIRVTSRFIKICALYYKKHRKLHKNAKYSKTMQDTFIKIWALDFMPDKARAIRDLWCGSWNFCTQGKLYIQPHAKQIQTYTIKIHYTIHSKLFDSAIFGLRVTKSPSLAIFLLNPEKK